MQTSEQINELTAALAKAQGEITGALKDSANPFFKSKYADLASCWDACRAPLSKNGLAVFQSPETIDGGLYLTTTLSHASGQWIRSTLHVSPKDDTPQAMGSALTYARRYMLTAVVGIAQVDDDGNAASGRAATYSAPITPQSNISMIPEEVAFQEAVRMRETLEADVSEDVKALKVLDLHDALVKNQELYQAASGVLNAKERSGWKAYVKQAQTREKEDRASSVNGRRF